MATQLRPFDRRSFVGDDSIDRPRGTNVLVLLVVLVTVVGFQAGTVGAITITIGFEEFAEGTGLTTQYEAAGVRFVVQDGADVGAIVKTCDEQDSDCVSAQRGQNAIVTPVDSQATPGEFVTPREPLVVAFTEPQETVRLYVQEGGGIQVSQTATLIARDEAGEIVARSVIGFEVGNGWHRISVSTDTASISEVTLTLADEGRLDDPHNVLVVDDVTFQRNAPPRADFEFAPDGPMVGQTVSFDASQSGDPDGDIVEYRWDFDGDNSIDEIRQVPTTSRTFPEPGTYAVTLEVVDGEGATDRITRQVTVEGEPNALCSVSDTEIEEGERVIIDASQSNAELVRFDTDGDGSFDRTNDNDFREVVTYREPGTYTPVIRAEIGQQGDFRQCSTIHVSSESRDALGPDVIVGATGGVIGVWFLRRGYSKLVNDDDNRPNHPPKAEITHAPDEPAPGRPVLIDGSQSADPDSGDRIVSYRWSVDDREPRAPRFVHVFLRTGEHDVELEVIDSHGAVGTTSETIAVNETRGDFVLERVHPDAPGDDHENLVEEYLVFENAGDDALGLDGWSIHDAAEEENRVTEGRHTFTFPDGFELDPGVSVIVHTGIEPEGAADFDDTDEERHLFWGKRWAVWNNEEDVIVVQDDGGHPIMAVRYERTDAGEYSLENLDVEVLEDWFPEVVISSRENAPLMSVSFAAGTGLSAVSAVLGFVAGAIFLRGPKPFLKKWANITGYTISSSLTWGLLTVTGLLPRTIEPIIPVLLVLGSLFMVVIGGVGTFLHWAISALRNGFT